MIRGGGSAENDNMEMTLDSQAVFTDRGNCINCGSADLAEIARGRFSEPPLVDFINADPWNECPSPYLREAEWIFAGCRQCGQAFHRRILNGEWNDRRFSTWMNEAAIRDFESMAGHLSPAKRFQRGRTFVEHILRLEKLTRRIRSNEPVRLLDFGCGFGEFLAACSVFGFDCSGVDRSTARRDGAVVPIFSSFEELNDAKPFHVICLFEVLEHLDDPRELLAKLATKMVSGGILILETPNCSGVTGISSLDDYRKIHPLDHINAFTRETLTSIAERTGFRGVRSSPAHVTEDRKRILKQEAKHLLRRDFRETQLYFQKN